MTFFTFFKLLSTRYSLMGNGIYLTRTRSETWFPNLYFDVFAHRYYKNCWNGNILFTQISRNRHLCLNIWRDVWINVLLLEQRRHGRSAHTIAETFIDGCKDGQLWMMNKRPRSWLSDPWSYGVDVNISNGKCLFCCEALGQRDK